MPMLRIVVLILGFILSATSAWALPDCGSGYEKSGAFCYPPCKANYNGVGPVCWQACPDGFKNDGATCRKDAHIVSRPSYGRGAGSPMGCKSDEEKDGALCYPKCKNGYNGVGPICWQKCPDGYKNDGATCRDPGDIFSKKSYGRGVGKLPPKKNCGGDCEKDAGLWYKRCQSGYNGRGPVCWQTCPSGYKNDGATCRKPVKIDAKKSYGRGVGRTLRTCDSNEEKDGALCYPKCKNGYNGVGPVCWGKCEDGYKNDGATCRKDVKIVAKTSYGRGVGKFIRRDYEGIFFRYMRDHHNLYYFRGKPLRENEKTYLKRFFPVRLVDGVRIVEELASSGAFIHKASATTYGNNLIVINKNRAGNRSLKLLKHEMVHICQYDVLGIKGFAEEYTNGYVDNGYEYRSIPMEADAYDYEELDDAITLPVSAPVDWRVPAIMRCK